MKYLFLATFLWGFGLVGQSMGMTFLEPVSFSAIRLTVGGLTILPLVLWQDRKKKRENPGINIKQEYWESFKGALVCVPCVLSAMLLQQFGLLYTSVGKCAFISAFYIFLVPLIELVTGKLAPVRLWIAVVIAAVGLYLITMPTNAGGLNIGDILCFLSAFAYAVYIYYVGLITTKVNSVKLSMLMFTTCGLISFVLAFLLEPGSITLHNCIHSVGAIIISGVASCGIGFTLQIVGQANVDSAKASLIMSGETIFALLTGWIFLHEVLKVNEYVGCAVMGIAIVMAVLPEKR